MTKFFTEQVPGGSRRDEASDEDMQRRTDFGAEEISDDSTFFMPEGGGGFVGRGKGLEH